MFFLGTELDSESQCQVILSLLQQKKKKATDEEDKEDGREEAESLALPINNPALKKLAMEGEQKVIA